MSSTLERHVVTVGGLRVGDGPAVVIDRRISLRGPGGATGASGPGGLGGASGPGGLGGTTGPGGSGAAIGWDRVEAWRDGVTLVEPGSAADLPAIAEAADGVVIGAAWTRDIPLVRAVAGLGLPVVVERRASATLEEWLGLADYCALECDDRVILCETGRLDLGLLRAARAASGRPVLADVSADLGLSAAAVAAGADGLIVRRPVGSTGDALRTEEHGEADVRLAEEAVTLVGALLRPETPATLPKCRQAIDRVDAALATLLERRAALAGIVQTLKPVGGFAGRDMARERALVARMAEHAPELGEARLVPIMNAVIEAGLSLAEERSANGRSPRPETTT
ncbi:chorismate mutase [Nonomuraea aurantiaca]|uniref:chorismate mutase n=1 Tax=Nonomuraea aurantiaca TaxID=2878562 RepID=UPI0027DF2EE5|nr:chorismate mutase [Nonomuraea aurantiaca]